MSTGYVAPVRRTIASRPVPTKSLSAKNASNLRLAMGPGYSLSAVSERLIRQATRG